ncbi:PepSY domain-containing protein [Streptomyces sp. NBC_00059]|uniref:PepSY domain-containing protein n=1 Tax=Streptomyces sp. NBC_00059 TaxID=2975635 RepID=UPI002257D37C|nr:PepSY domain-containing protein [Streptomyces sp. NBC_00059]MCX5414810.1 PepSY domain-containing protein [Streptomyces sp. NBC_00059]
MRFEPRRNKTVSPRTRRLRVAGGALCAAALAATLVTGCGQDSGDKTAAATSEAAKVLPKQTTSPSESVSGSPSATGQLTEAQTKRKDVLSNVKIPFDKAATTAVGEVSGGKLVDLDLEGLDDDDDASGSPSPAGSPSPTGSPTGSPSPTGSASPSGSSDAPKWIAEVVEEDGTAHDVTIDAVSGKVLDSTTDADQSDADKQELAEQVAKATQTPEQAAKVATDKTDGWVTSISLDENDSQVLVWQVDVVTKDWNRTVFDVDAAKGTITDEQIDDN